MAWPIELVYVQPYSMAAAIRYDYRRVTMPNGTQVIRQATGTRIKMDIPEYDILYGLFAPRHVNMAAKRLYNDESVLLRVQIPGLEKIAAGIKPGGYRGQAIRAAQARGEDLAPQSQGFSRRPGRNDLVGP